MDPLRIANNRARLYSESDMDCLLLEDDFKKLVRDALPAAEEIMRIQIKRPTPPSSVASSRTVGGRPDPLTIKSSIRSRVVPAGSGLVTEVSESSLVIADRFVSFVSGKGIQ